jgi:hypothetical protein
MTDADDSVQTASDGNNTMSMIDATLAASPVTA